MGADASPFAGEDQNNPTEQRHGDEPGSAGGGPDEKRGNEIATWRQTRGRKCRESKLLRSRASESEVSTPATTAHKRGRCMPRSFSLVNWRRHAPQHEVEDRHRAQQRNRASAQQCRIQSRRQGNQNQFLKRAGPNARDTTQLPALPCLRDLLLKYIRHVLPEPASQRGRIERQHPSIKEAAYVENRGHLFFRCARRSTSSMRASSASKSDLPARVSL